MIIQCVPISAQWSGTGQHNSITGTCRSRRSCLAAARSLTFAGCACMLAKSRQYVRRFEQKDLQSTKQANDWKSFMGGKGSKKKAGFMTKQKESMFAVPDSVTGKVGVVGSGQGMTDGPTKRSRIDF